MTAASESNTVEAASQVPVTKIHPGSGRNPAACDRDARRGSGTSLYQRSAKLAASLRVPELVLGT